VGAIPLSRWLCALQIDEETALKTLEDFRAMGMRRELAGEEEALRERPLRHRVHARMEAAPQNEVLTDSATRDCAAHGAGITTVATQHGRSWRFAAADALDYQKRNRQMLPVGIG